MSNMNFNKTGLTLGLTFAMFSVVCAILIAIIPQTALIVGINLLFHGLDVSSIVTTSISFMQVVFGSVLMFAVGWLIGVLFAWINNAVNSGNN